MAISEHLETVANAVLSLPVSKAARMRLVEQSEGRAVCRLEATEAVCANTGALSGGDLYGLLDTVAYLALIPLVPDADTAATHDAHFSLLTMAPLGSEVEIRSEVQRQGRNVAFMRVEAFVVTSDGMKLLALATVTKSIISLEQRLRHRSAASSARE
jgi:acyl-coenzyme A thioesterase PaaI-like protein